MTLDKLVQVFRMVTWVCPDRNINGEPTCRLMNDCPYKGDSVVYNYHECHLYDLNYGNEKAIN